MKIAKFIVFISCNATIAAYAVSNDFMSATRVLSAANRGDARQVQVLVANGADINFVDSTGLSLVCTALMNNDLTAVRILQSYGADSSNCDTQIKDYRNRNVPEKTGGMFSGLSTTQGLVLTGAGMAAAVGGLALVTNAFSPDDNNNYGGGSGGGSGGGNDEPTVTANPLFTSGLPYGPSLPNSTLEAANYASNVAYYLPSDEDSILYKNFQLMTNDTATSQNYLLLMRGYSGFARGYLGMRTLRNSSTNAPVLLDGAQWGSLEIGGGRPVNVALVTANGINAAEDTSLENKYMVWAGVNTGGILGQASNYTISSKYYNNLLTVAATDEYSVEEDTSFDYSGDSTPTAIHNESASEYDNMLAKIVGGSDAGYSDADFFGFMPNGQMTIYRTGGGNGTDYYNYRAILNAANKSSDLAGGRSRVDIIANVDVIDPLHETDAKTINDILAVTSDEYKSTFASFVANIYGSSDVDNLPSVNAREFFNSLGYSYTPLTIFSTGAAETDDTFSGACKIAAFENAAPLVYPNTEHLFMSVVAVGASTYDTSSISVNSDTNKNKYQLAQWYTTSNGDVNYYKSRICGAAGTGRNGKDPWCFAATGITDEMAVSAAAGAAGLLRSAFYYMEPQQIYMLLALTADGPFLSRLTDGTALTTETLISHLQSMYDMPTDYQALIDDGADYLDVFKQVYGYGVINLERATTPGTNLYFYSDNNKIVSTSGNAYWRAATNTNLRASSALNLGGVSISTAAYDMLESNDGSMSLPRVWTNEISFTDGGRHALYMGDVLGDLRVRSDDDNKVQFGNFAFSLNQSERAYDDNFGGLDNMRLEYASGNWNLSADYQRYLTNGESRFYGMSNPVLNLASNAVTGGARYSLGNWVVGAHAFSGAVTDEGLLESDPSISAVAEPMRLGTVSGAQSEFGWNAKHFGMTMSAGAMRETNTVLGAYATGLIDINSADTNYIDFDAFWKPSDMVHLRARATFAYTSPDTAMGTAVDMSDLYSNAFAFGADVGSVTFGLSMPLAVTRGGIKYAYADYDVVSDDDGHYNLVVSNASMRHVNIAPDSREFRLNAVYRHEFGSFTNGAFGFIYRINPNNIRDYGNESIFMMKLSHALGI